MTNAGVSPIILDPPPTSPSQTTLNETYTIPNEKSKTKHQFNSENQENPKISENSSSKQKSSTYADVVSKTFSSSNSSTSNRYPVRATKNRKQAAEYRPLQQAPSDVLQLYHSIVKNALGPLESDVSSDLRFFFLVPHQITGRLNQTPTPEQIISTVRETLKVFLDKSKSDLAQRFNTILTKFSEDLETISHSEEYKDYTNSYQQFEMLKYMYPFMDSKTGRIYWIPEEADQLQDLYCPRLNMTDLTLLQFPKINTEDESYKSTRVTFQKKWLTETTFEDTNNTFTFRLQLRQLISANDIILILKLQTPADLTTKYSPISLLNSFFKEQFKPEQLYEPLHISNPQQHIDESFPKMPILYLNYFFILKLNTTSGPGRHSTLSEKVNLYVLKNHAI